MGIENYFAFILTAFIFIITPGIDTIFVLNKSIAQGKRAGVYSTLGLNAGVLVHTLCAALGLSLIIAKSALAFAVVKYLGAAYLVYLGVSKLISKGSLIELKENEAVVNTGKQNFMSGLFTNVLNPKVALFFMAFFPQFIQPEQINNPIPFIILGLTCAAISVLWFTVVTFFASLFSKKLLNNVKASEWLNKASGMVFILMGIKIAFTKR